MTKGRVLGSLGFMNRWLISLVTLSALLTAAPASAEPHGHWRGGERESHDRDSGGRGRYDTGSSDIRRGSATEVTRTPERRWEREAGPARGDAWDDRRHDGYWLGQRWFCGGRCRCA